MPRYIFQLCVLYWSTPRTSWNIWTCFHHVHRAICACSEQLSNSVQHKRVQHGSSVPNSFYMSIHCLNRTFPSIRSISFFNILWTRKRFVWNGRKVGRVASWYEWMSSAQLKYNSEVTNCRENQPLNAKYSRLIFAAQESYCVARIRVDETWPIDC